MIGEEVHNWVGAEPSGLLFNAPILDSKNRPHLQEHSTPYSSSLYFVLDTNPKP